MIRYSVLAAAAVSVAVSLPASAQENVNSIFLSSSPDEYIFAPSIPSPTYAEPAPEPESYIPAPESYQEPGEVVYLEPAPAPAPETYSEPLTVIEQAAPAAEAIPAPNYAPAPEPVVAYQPSPPAPPTPSPTPGDFIEAFAHEQAAGTAILPPLDQVAAASIAEAPTGFVPLAGAALPLIIGTAGAGAVAAAAAAGGGSSTPSTQ